MDRVSLSERPAGGAAGTQRWRHLLFAHWAVPIAAMRALVPESMELDLWDGQALAGVVPFEMCDVRSSWMPPGLGLSFLETNLRTYVIHRGEPGVFFLSLEAASLLAVKVARLRWGLPYYHAKMSLEVGSSEIRYTTFRRGNRAVRLETEYELGEFLGASEPGTVEHFLLERYLLFVNRRGQIYRGQVHHVPYPAHRVERCHLDETLLEAVGLSRHHGPPDFLHYSSGVDVEVFSPRRS